MKKRASLSYKDEENRQGIRIHSNKQTGSDEIELRLSQIAMMIKSSK